MCADFVGQVVLALEENGFVGKGDNSFWKAVPSDYPFSLGGLTIFWKCSPQKSGGRIDKHRFVVPFGVGRFQSIWLTVDRCSARSPYFGSEVGSLLSGDSFRGFVQRTSKSAAGRKLHFSSVESLRRHFSDW